MAKKIFELPKTETFEIFIGIDTGVNTGIAVWDAYSKKFLRLETVKIHRAMEIVRHYHETNGNIHVKVEDARKRKFFGGYSAKDMASRLQGAGSVKRDASVWEDYLKDLGCSFEMRIPKDTKISEAMFLKLTGWSKRISHHARDAAMMVYNS